jgi:hypothetical protein
MKTRAVVQAIAILSVAALAGCSISYSSQSLSNSSGSSSDSSSSSSPGASERAYQRDVSDYTRAFVKSHGTDLQGFQTDLAHLAAERGITNWEENPSTYTAIGAGLAGANASSAEVLAYKRNLAGGDQRKADLIQQGYDGTR